MDDPVGNAGPPLAKALRVAQEFALGLSLLADHFAGGHTDDPATVRTRKYAIDRAAAVIQTVGPLLPVFEKFGCDSARIFGETFKSHHEAVHWVARMLVDWTRQGLKKMPWKQQLEWIGTRKDEWRALEKNLETELLQTNAALQVADQSQSIPASTLHPVSDSGPKPEEPQSRISNPKPMPRGTWAASKTDGMPLRGWDEICQFIEKPNERSRRDQLKRLNERTFGPIKWVGDVPEVNRGEMKAWIEDSEGRAAALNARRESDQAATAELQERGSVRQGDYSMHAEKRPNARGKARAAPDEK